MRYSTRESEIRLEEARAWVAFAEGKGEDAARLLRAAADREDVARFELAIPAREMLGELLLELKQPAQALAEFETSLRLSPNRFNALYGAGHAAELAGNSKKAASYYAQLLKICDGGAHSDRPELTRAKTSADACFGPAMLVSPCAPKMCVQTFSGCWWVTPMPTSLDALLCFGKEAACQSARDCLSVPPSLSKGELGPRRLRGWYPVVGREVACQSV